MSVIQPFLQRNRQFWRRVAGDVVESVMGANVAILRPREGVCLDPVRLASLYSDLGETEAETLVARAMSELVLVLSEMLRQYGQGDWPGFSRNLRALRRMADHVGLTGLAVAALAVADCLEQSDATALTATWARLVRLGKQSLDRDGTCLGQIL